MQQKISVRQLCLMGILCALFAVLDYFSIGVGQTIKITFAGLPILLAAVTLGSIPAVIVGLTGSLTCQLIKYGFGWMTLLWILPAGLRGLSMGLIFKALGEKCQNPAWLFVPVVISSLLVTAVNTGVTYLDSIIFHYYTPGLIAGALGVRIISSILTSVVYVITLVPLMKALKTKPGKSK